MAGSSSVSGLASGLDTATIISQLMQLEAAPQTRLKTRVSSEQTVVTALQTLNTKVATLSSKAEALAKPSAWQPLSTSSSNSNVSVTTATGASPTNLNVTVTAVAQTHQLGFANAAALTDVVTGASTKVTLDRFDGSPVEVETGDGTLSGLVNALNNPANATGVHATLVKVSDGAYRLLVESEKTGAAEDFDLTALDGSPLLGGAAVRQGSDASIDLGTGITASSTTNTFTDLVPGITLALGAGASIGDVAKVTVTRDSSSLSSQVSGLVDSINSLLSDIDSGSAYNATSKTSGPLSGDGTVRNLRSAVLNSIFPTDGTSLASLGIQTTRDGKLEFDATVFAQAYAADPAGVAEKFNSDGDGFAARVAAVSDGFSDPTDGTLTAAITGRKSGISRMEDSIDEWDRRLELRRATLESQFTALETAMSQMQSQSSWLSSQLSSLSTG